MSSSLDNVNVKRALLIGNNNYNEGEKLDYCINNVNDMKNKLEGIHFKVVIGIDLICEEMDSIIEEFIKDINPGDLIIFFYSGYGIHLNSENYFIPIDNEEILNYEMFKYRTINVQTTLQMIIDRRPSSSVFIFDCSRIYLISNQMKLNDFINCGGFSPIEPLNGSLIMYSCDANQTIVDKSINGRNNIFVNHLIENIDKVNFSIDELMDIISDQVIIETNHLQIPFIKNSLRKNIYFNYQIQAETSQRRTSLIKDLIVQCKNGSLVNLRNHQLIDRDMKIIVEEVFIHKQCTTLWLDGNRLTSIGASILSSALNNNTTLERLYLSGNSISDIGVKYLSKTLSINNKSLKIVGLQQNGITDIGLEHLSQMLKTNESLTGLWLQDNSISDKGIICLTNILKDFNSSLQYIDLSKNKLITDLSVDYIINIIKFNKSINEISLFDCSLSTNGKDKIKKAIKSKKNFSIYLNTWNE